MMTERIVVGALAALLGAHAHAVVPGQVDDFSDGTTMGWGTGASTSSPTWIASGGPAGAGDGFLRVTSDGGSGPGGKPVVINFDQWSGDYSGQGITAVRMDVRNSGATTLYVRCGVWGTTPPRIGTLDFMEVLPGTGWQTVEIDLTDLGPVVPPPVVEDILSDIFQFRILSAQNQSWNGDLVAATMDLDNITAVATVDPCPSDFDDDGMVGASDLAILLAAWGGSGPGDVDASGVVDSGDLAIVLAAWGACPE